MGYDNYYNHSITQYMVYPYTNHGIWIVGYNLPSFSPPQYFMVIAPRPTPGHLEGPGPLDSLGDPLQAITIHIRTGMEYKIYKEST